MKYALLAVVALGLAGCGNQPSGGGLAPGVAAVLCPTQTQGRTEGDNGCKEPPAAPQTQGRTN